MPLTPQKRPLINLGKYNQYIANLYLYVRFGHSDVNIYIDADAT